MSLEIIGAQWESLGLSGNAGAHWDSVEAIGIQESPVGLSCGYLEAIALIGDHKDSVGIIAAHSGSVELLRVIGVN